IAGSQQAHRIGLGALGRAPHMTSRRSNRALLTTRRWTAGVLLDTSLTAGGWGLPLADAYASNQSATVAAATTSQTGTSTSTDSPASTSPSDTSHSPGVRHTVSLT